MTINFELLPTKYLKVNFEINKKQYRIEKNRTSDGYFFVDCETNKWHCSINEIKANKIIVGYVSPLDIIVTGDIYFFALDSYIIN